MTQNKKISSFQLMIILIHSQIGLSIITLPHELALIGESPKWLVVLLAGCIVQITIFIISFLKKRFPSRNLYEIIEILFGKIIGKTIIFMYIIYFILTGGLILTKFTVVLKSWMMPLTPKWILILLITMLAIYAAKENLVIISRFLTISTIVIILFLFFIIYALKDAHLTYLFPIEQINLIPMSKGVLTAFFAFQGFEYLFFISSSVELDRKAIIKTATITNIIVTVFYTFILTVMIMFFSAKELIITPEPTFYLVKSFTFKLVERPDLLFTSMWLILIVTSLIMLFHVVSLGFKTMVNTNKRTVFVIISATLCYILAMNINGEYEINNFATWFNPFIFVFSVILPLLFLLIAIIFNKKEENTVE